MTKSINEDILDDYLSDIEISFKELKEKFDSKSISKEQYNREFMILKLRKEKIYLAKDKQLFSFKLTKEYEGNSKGEVDALRFSFKKELPPEQRIIRKQLDFKRLSEKRMQKVIKNLRSIKKLFNKTNYNYKDEWVQEMQVVLQKELNNLFDFPGNKVVLLNKNARDADLLLELEEFKDKIMEKNIQLEMKIHKLKAEKEYEVKLLKAKYRLEELEIKHEMEKRNNKIKEKK